MSKRTSPYVPSFLRTTLDGHRPIELTFSDVQDTNILSTSSFIYDPADAPLKSTQQLNVDWSRFENHTFFMSAEAKCNIAFEQIINGYPFDGTRAEIESFFERMTGFDRWVFDEFPKYHGQLVFTGTMPGETLPTAGSYIITKDAAGTLYPELSKTATGASVLNPRGTSLSIEMQLYVPPTATLGNQIVCQKMNGADHGFSLYLLQTASTSSVSMNFSVVSGSVHMTTECTLDKGRFNHVCVTLNRELGVHHLESFRDGVSVHVARSRSIIGDLDIDASDMIIGSGTALALGGTSIVPTQTLSGTIDEFRVFHSARSPEQQRLFARKGIFAQPDLKLYYRFNEPPPPLSTSDRVNAIVIDSSGNSLHSFISNFETYSDTDTAGALTGSALRQDASLDPTSNVVYEKDESVPVLFPAYDGVVDLNVRLLASATLYDQANANIITRLIPPHYLLEGSLFDGLEEPEGNSGTPYGGDGMPGEGKLGNVQLMLSLLYTWARFFDELKLYVDAFSSLRTVDYDTNVSVPNNFLHDIVKLYGFHLPPMFNDSTLEQYIRAENVDIDTIGTSALPLKSVQNELLRRVLVNIPGIIRSKGTQHSIRAFLRAVGIDPDNSVRLREFGGPTVRQLSYARECKRDTGTMVEFSSSSLSVSPFLSASRYEPGYPTIAGTWVQQDRFPPNGTSDQPDDGLLTSGSWTLETIVKYTPYHVNLMTSATQSLARLCVTGTMPGGLGLVANVLAVSSSIDPKLILYVRPGSNQSSPLLCVSMSVPIGTVFDGEKWNVSFGCERNDSIGSTVSSSYFLRLGTQVNGEVDRTYVTSSFFHELISSESNCFRHLTSSNGSGTFIAVGENSIIPSGSSGYLYLNDISVCDPEARVTAFTGLQSNLRFWSKALTTAEWLEHVRNYRSLGVVDPLVNYNFVSTRSGSFERVRMDSFGRQSDRWANATASLGATGLITFLDFSLNGMHMTGTGFPIDRAVVRGELFDVSYPSPHFDEAVLNEKVRVRGYLEQELIDSTPWASTAPVYEIVASERPTDDTRFSVEFSLIDAVNRDIITMFATLDAMDNAIGAPELVFSPDYPDLERLRNVYFNRLGEKLNFKAFLEFFRWFDTSIGTFIRQLVPRRTNFRDTNFVVESHVLERAKLQYAANEQYVSELNRARIRDVLLVQLITGNVRKY